MNQQDDTDYEALLAAGTENARYQRMMEQQKAQADYMRQLGAPAQGQMVSGHYVPPSWTQHLASLGNTVMSGLANKQAMESGNAWDTSMGKQQSIVLRQLLRDRMRGAQPGTTPQPGTPIPYQAPMDNPYEST